MKKTGLVSIITPCYNMETRVWRLMDSVIAQTYRPIEFILVDDGSTDDSLQVAETYRERFAKADVRYKIVHQENKGLGGAINAGLLEVTGDYFCWPDADDYLEPTSVEERVLAFLEHPECGVVTSNAYIRDSSDLNTVISTLGNNERFSEPKQFLYHLNGDSIFCSGCHMANTEKFRAVVPSMQIYPARRGQNWQLLLPLYYAYDRFYLDKPLYNYIVYPNSMSHDKNTHQAHTLRYDEHETILKKTLAQIEIAQDVDLHEYFSFIENKYAKLRLEAAIRFHDKEVFLDLYAKKQRMVGLDSIDRLALIRSQSPIIDKLLCGCWKLAKKELSLVPEKVAYFVNTWGGADLRRIKVSVLVPCYNAEEYIETCLQCLLYQSHQNMEVILVNDGSTDRSDAIIQKYLSRFDEQGISVVYLKEENAGAAAAVDMALSKVTGKYIMLYDTDDVLYRDAVYEKVKYLENHPDFNMVVNNGYYVKTPYALGEDFFYYRKPNVDTFFEDLITGKNNNWPGSYMIRTDEFWKRIPSNGHIYTSQFGQNLQFMLPMAYKAKVGYIEKPLMNYYVRPSSHSHYGGIERTLERAKGYTNNRIEILKSMPMEEIDRDKYISRIISLANISRDINGNRVLKRGKMRLISRAINKIMRTIKGIVLELKLECDFYR